MSVLRSQSPLCEPAEPLIEHADLGASTGYMEALRDDWPALLDEARRVSVDVVELSALSGRELVPLGRFLESDVAVLGGYNHVSVHAPSKGWASSTGALIDALIALPGLVRGIVVHPDSMGEPELYAALDERLWLENMDTRKHDGRTVEELARYFDLLPHAGFCFDIAHAGLHDPSMALAHELLDAFGDRLREVHLSSIEPDGIHVPLTDEDEDRFGPVLARCRDVAWILEAPLLGR